MMFAKYKKIIVFVVLFFLLWAIAWLIHNFLSATIWLSLDTSHNQNLFYWAIMKIVVWVVFPVIYIKKVYQSENLNKFFGLQNTKKGIIYGLGASIVWLTLSYFFQGSPKFDLIFSLTSLWTITGTPISEEFTFRGVILPGLQKAGMTFWSSNIITSIIFILIHCLGWAFQGVLSINLFSITTGSILLLSLAVGWLRHKSDSLYGSIILHSLNNLFSTLR